MNGARAQSQIRLSLTTTPMYKLIRILVAISLLAGLISSAAGAPPALTPEEHNWLTAHPTITLATVPSWAPLSMRDNNADISGIVGDYKRLLEQRLNINLTLGEEIPWPEVLERARNRQVDVVMLLGKTEAREAYLNFTDVLIDLPYVIITRTDYPATSGIASLAGKRVAVAAGFVAHEWLVKDHPEIIVVPKESTPSAIESVAMGETDAYVGDIASVSNTIEVLGIGRLKVASGAAFTNQLRIGVRKDWPELVSILNKGIASLDEKDRRTIWDKWVTLQSQGIDPRIVYAVTLGLGLVIIGLLVAGNRTLNTREAHYRGVIETSADGFLTLDMQGRVLEVNDAYVQLSGHTRQELLGMSIHELEADRTPDEAAALIRDIKQTGHSHFETLHKTKSGKTWPVEAVASYWPREGERLFIFCKDITARKEAEKEIQNLAFYDALTQLPNRRLLSDRLEQAMAAGTRTRRYGALMFIDLDKFKPLNDRYGHAVGDLLLKEAAHRISACVRRADTVARFGGDEFIVMLGELDADKSESARQALAVATKIGAALSEPYVLPSRPLSDPGGETGPLIEHRCTSSIGVTLFLDSKRSQDDILRSADSAMYQAKAGMGNSIQFFAPS
jgi:diguanylate cyclase (GGDEF)-like protein/PAS domain S-box-containing protein